MNDKSKSVKHEFPCMQGKGNWVGVAFRKGRMEVPFEATAMVATLGPYVHTELIVGKDSLADVYSSFESKDAQYGFVRSDSVFDKENWSIVYLPLQSLTHAQGMSLALLASNVPYNHNDLWQCCITCALPFEEELACDQVEDWKTHGVFCSQMCLLFLRSLMHHGDLVTAPGLAHMLENTHSRGCSPNLLFGILNSCAYKLL